MQATIRIKGYDRVEQFAMGRRAVLFRARDRENNRPVVFKVLLPHLVEDPRFLKRFKRDVRLAAELHHENLVNVLLYGRADDSVFVAFEQYRGRRLDAIVSDCRRVPIPIALHIIAGLAAALDACHGARVIHRDVRPANVILTSGGDVKLDNLTLATEVGSAGGVQFAGRVSTTVAYMSPEQLRGENLSAQSDVFSLGVLAWELFAGKSAFGEGGAESIADRVQSEDLPAVSSLNPMVEPAIAQLIDRMVAKDRTGRCPGASEVLAGLQNAVTSHAQRADRDAVAAFVEDPVEYTESYTRREIERLNSDAPTGQTASPQLLLRHYEKLVYLEPSNTRARSEVSRLRKIVRRAEKCGSVPPDLVCADSAATYRVVLESLDGSRETRESFAVKLATRLRVPLTAVQGYVENMPVALPGEHPHRKAVFLAGLLEELGGIARIETTRPERETPDRCPECGSPVEARAEFCPFCQHRFVSYVELQPGLGDVDDEPLHARGATSPPLLNALKAMPPRTRILVGLLGVLALVLLITSVV